MRIAALTLLIVSSPTPSRLISLYWYLHSEPSQHLYNYFYTTLKSMERTTHPCSVHLGAIAAQFMRVLRKPDNYLTTGNYMFDYQDTYRKFGAMLNGIVIANPVTNVPEVFYATFNSYGSGTYINHVSLYVKAEGLAHSFSKYFDGVTPLKDVLRRFKLDQKEKAPIHMEIIARVQHKTILCLHLNETHIARAMGFLSGLEKNLYNIYQNMEFHVNQQRINVPLTMESIQVTDLGTNIRLAITTTSLFSMRGNFTYTASGRNNHAILRTSIHGTEIIESYNPLFNIWHAAERAQSIHGYLPVNITFGLGEWPFISYDTPGEHMKMGFTGHARTSTSIKGADIKVRLNRICPWCPQVYTVTKSELDETKRIDLYDAEVPELGGQIHVNIFDCESPPSRDSLIADIFSSHQANYQILPAMQFVLIGLHFLDYFTYVPPKGSCGIAAFINTVNTRRSNVKLEYVKNRAHHLIALTNQDAETFAMLHQWTVAVMYQSKSWMTGVLKIKATRVEPGQKVLKICVEAERHMPWDWDFLSVEPSDASNMRLNLVWGLADSAKGKCSGSMILLNIIGNISQAQITESRLSKWPYNKCQADMKGKNYVPYTVACYETSKELSTLRKYQAVVQYHNVPPALEKFAWRLRGLYDLVGNSSLNPMTEQFILSAEFPRDSAIGEISLNKDKIRIEYNYNLIDFFLVRTRIHKYTDTLFFKTFFDTCIVKPNYIRSVHNVTNEFREGEEVLLLGQCYNDNPQFALTARNHMYYVKTTIYDETDTLIISPNQDGGAVFNASIPLLIPPSEFYPVGSKRIKVEGESVDLIIPNINFFVRWTQKQIVLFIPKYALEFSCGMCTLQTNTVDNLYKEV